MPCLPVCQTVLMYKSHYKSLHATWTADRFKTAQSGPRCSSFYRSVVFSINGKLPNTSGQEHENDKFQVGTLFVDEGTGFMFVDPQISLGAEDTVVGNKHLGMNQWGGAFNQKPTYW